MDFELSADQVALQDAARELLDDLAAPARVRAVVDTGAAYDADLWTAMVAQGWAALSVPEPLGGLGFGPVEVAVLLEQVGGHAAPAPFLPIVVAQGALVRALADGDADGEAVPPLLQPLVGGAAVAAVAWRPVTARPDGAGGWLLSGVPEPLPYAPCADLVVLPAETPDGLALFALRLTEAERPPAEPAMDRTRPLGWLRLEAHPGIRLGGPSAVEAHLDLGAMACAAQLLGGASTALAMSVAYAGERQQFGRPIGSFQAVKHRCADMLVDVEGMRSATYYAAWALGAGDAESDLAASTAKAWCSDASARVLASALQVHGGIGFTWEHDLHLFLKRGQLDQVSFGDAAHHRARIAGILRARVAAGQPVL